MTEIIGIRVSVKDHNTTLLFDSMFWYKGQEGVDEFLDNLHKILDIPEVKL